MEILRKWWFWLLVLILILIIISLLPVWEVECLKEECAKVNYWQLAYYQ